MREVKIETEIGKFVYVIQDTPDLTVGQVINEVIGKIEVDIGVKLMVSGLRVIPVIAIERGLDNKYASWIVEGKKISEIATDFYICNSANVRPLTPQEIISSKDNIRLIGRATPEFLKTIGWSVSEKYGGLKDGEYGHARAWYYITMMGKRVTRWWTECQGSGSLCPYDHPNGWEVEEVDA